MTMVETSREIQSLEELYPVLGQIGVFPGWRKPTPSLWAEPRKTYVPMHWRYSDIKPALACAGDLIPVEQADRRNLFMYSPVGGNTYDTTRTLVAAYQMIKPGETATSHRHTPNALRCIIDAEEGLYTVVDGVRLPMMPGDVLLTPSWSWHGHANESGGDGYWVDILDVPLVHLLEPMFFEHFAGGLQPAAETPAQHPFLFTWADSMEKLKDAPHHRHFGRQAELGNPAFPTMGLYMSVLEKGEHTDTLRTTASSIYVVMTGRGSSIVDGEVYRWNPGDVIAVPAWRPHTHQAEIESILFRATDEPALKSLGFLRTHD